MSQKLDIILAMIKLMVFINTNIKQFFLKGIEKNKWLFIMLTENAFKMFRPFTLLSHDAFLGLWNVVFPWLLPWVLRDLLIHLFHPSWKISQQCILFGSKLKVVHHLQCCYKIWKGKCVSVELSNLRNMLAADGHTTYPSFRSVHLYVYI